MIAAANERREGRSDPFEEDVSAVVMLRQGIRNLRDSQKDSALCIASGARFPWLREVWPSKDQKFWISSDGEVGPELIEMVERFSDYAYNRLTLFLDHDLPNTFDILVLNASVPRYRNDPFHRALELCLPTINNTGVGAYALDGIAVFCFDRHLNDQQVDEILPTVQRAILHELFHVAQYQLVAPGSKHHQDDFVANFGPAWLLEGSAQVFQDVRSEFCTERGMQFLISHASKDLTGIGSLVEYEQFRALQDEAYDVSHYAACLLALNRGIEGIVEFYKILGEGERWRIAFQAAFGFDYDAFVELVEAKVSSERKGTP
jgi:hypothetical protein